MVTYGWKLQQQQQQEKKENVTEMTCRWRIVASDDALDTANWCPRASKAAWTSKPWAKPWTKRRTQSAAPPSSMGMLPISGQCIHVVAAVATAAVLGIAVVAAWKPQAPSPIPAPVTVMKKKLVQVVGLERQLAHRERAPCRVHSTCLRRLPIRRSTCRSASAYWRLSCGVRMLPSRLT